MVSNESVNAQLERIGFKRHGWGKGEVNELANILLPDEEIYECVNGIYEGGFALVVATDVRVLLIDKKPLNFLTVEDLRFDMINEIDYSHRLIGARISITTGPKNLVFHSYNQQRLRKLINHVQHCMADSKKKQSSRQEDQSLHLEKINDQLQAYLRSQHDYQKQLQQAQLARQAGIESAPLPEPVRPSPELSDYLFTQSLLAQHQARLNGAPVPPVFEASALTQQPQAAAQEQTTTSPPPVRTTPQIGQSEDVRLKEIYDDGLREVFGKHVHAHAAAQNTPVQPPAAPQSSQQTVSSDVSEQFTDWYNPEEGVSPLRIAYSKLPTVLQNRKFGRPSLYPHIKLRPNMPQAQQTEPDMAAAR